jgi:hypothetical protein
VVPRRRKASTTSKRFKLIFAQRPPLLARLDGAQAVSSFPFRQEESFAGAAFKVLNSKISAQKKESGPFWKKGYWHRAGTTPTLQ